MAFNDETEKKWRIFRDCQDMHISLWECPSFLFLILGILNIASTAGAYFIGTSYEVEPEVVALISIFVSFLFLVISFVIVGAFSKAAEANRVKTEFVGVASHQLRTPLTNIKFALEYLASPKHGDLNFNDRQMGQFRIMQESNDRLLKLVSDLLDLSRIEQGKIVIEKVPVSLKPITESVLQELQGMIALKKIKVHFETSPDLLPNVLADNSRIRMVIQNMLDNAVKYNRQEGDLWVKIEKKGGKIFWSVTDTGLGIPRGEQRRVFQKFYRSSNVVRDHSYGTGLGLHIAKVIVNELGGTIGFDSTEGRGSTFWFILPVQ